MSAVRKDPVDAASDCAWNDVVARHDLDGCDDPARLAEYERMLAEAPGDAAPLDPQFVEELVASATHAASPAAAPVLPMRRAWGVGRFAILAAALMVSVFLIANRSFRPVWKAGQNSRLSMTYAEAILLLDSRGESDENIQSALGLISENMILGIRAIQLLANSDATSQDLRADAIAHGANLRAMDPVLFRVRPGEAVSTWVATATKADLDVTSRRQSLTRVYELTALGFDVLRTRTHLPSGPDSMRQSFLKKLAAML